MIEKKRIAIIGSGGFAQEVEWLIHDIDKYTFSGFYVSDSLYENDKTSGNLVSLKRKIEDNIIDCAVIGIGDPKTRQELFQKFTDEIPGIVWETLIHPSVRFDKRSTKIGEGSIICAGSTATTNVKIGKNCAINLHVTIGHDTIIGNHCVINPGANISGNVKLGDTSLVGTGSTIIQKIELGSMITVGASACVTKCVQNGKTIVGVPAKDIVR